MVTTQDILDAARTLPESTRWQLIEALLAIDEPPGADAHDAVDAWRETATARAAELDAGSVRAIPWEQIRIESQQRIDERKTN